MKRFMLGAGWCMLLWMGCMLLGGIVVGAVAGATVGDPSAAAQAGQDAGAAFAAKYGNLVLLASIALSVAGTVTGWLPGTKSEKGASHAV